MNKEMKTLTFGDVTYEVVDEKAREGVNKHEAELLKAFVKVTTDPSPFHHITDSANMKVADFGMSGKTEQDTVPGNQLFDLANSKGFVSLYSGLSTEIDLENNTLTTTNTHTTDRTGSLDLGVLEAGTYYLSFENVNGYVTTPAIKYGELETGLTKITSLTITGGSFTIEEELHCWVVCTLNNDNPLKLKNIMLNKDSTALPVEKYVGGMPSPNPEHEEEITLAGVYNEETGRYEHKCCVGNKNWCKDVLTSTYVQSEGIEPSTTRTFAHNTYRKGFVADGSHNETTLAVNFLSDRVEVKYAYFGYGLGFPMQLPKGKTVTASLVGATSDNFTFYWAFYDNDGKHIGQEHGKSVVLIPNNCEWTVVIVSGNPNDGWVSFNAIQVELDFVETNYTPHASQPFTLTSPKPLTKWDNLAKVDGKWYWDYKQLKLVVDGSNLEFYDDTWRGFRIKNLLPEVMSRRDGYCTQLRVDYGNRNPEDTQNHMWLGASNQHLYIIGSSFYDSELDDKGLANFKAHLNEHPLEIVTYKDESELVPLLDEEQELLHNLEMYYGVTNVYNEQGCPMWLCYTCDSKLYVDQKLEQINNALLSLGANV